MTSLSDIRQLVAELERDPDDDQKFSVVVDWCEEVGFHQVVANCRNPSPKAGWGMSTLLRYQAIHALRVLFGDPSIPQGAESRARSSVLARWCGYTAVLGFSRVIIGARDTESVAAPPQQAFTARRLVIPAEVGQYLHVTDIVLGAWTPFVGMEGVSALMFGEYMPDLFERRILPHQIARVTIENISDVDVSVSCCLLGDALWIQDPTDMDDMKESMVLQEQRLVELTNRVQDLERAIIKKLSRFE